MPIPHHEAPERIDPPQYVAFRHSAGDSVLTVIASIELRDVLGHQCGHWYSEVTPEGEYRDVPVDAERYAIDGSIAQDLIELIRNGESLPPRFVRLLPAA